MWPRAKGSKVHFIFVYVVREGAGTCLWFVAGGGSHLVPSPADDCQVYPEQRTWALEWSLPVQLATPSTNTCPTSLSLSLFCEYYAKCSEWVWLVLKHNGTRTLSPFQSLWCVGWASRPRRQQEANSILKDSIQERTYLQDVSIAHVLHVWRLRDLPLFCFFHFGNCCTNIEDQEGIHV